MKKFQYYGAFLGLVATICTVPLLAAPKPSTKATSVTPLATINSFEDYQKDCLKRVRQQGLADDVGLDICKCTMTQFRSQYNIQQFRNLVQKAKADKTIARKLSEVGEACFEKVLYE
jgi:hypothetical protein